MIDNMHILSNNNKVTRLVNIAIFTIVMDDHLLLSRCRLLVLVYCQGYQQQDDDDYNRVDISGGGKKRITSAGLDIEDIGFEEETGDNLNPVVMGGGADDAMGGGEIFYMGLRLE